MNTLNPGADDFQLENAHAIPAGLTSSKDKGGRRQAGILHMSLFAAGIQSVTAGCKTAVDAAVVEKEGGGVTLSYFQIIYCNTLTFSDSIQNKFHIFT